MQINNNTYLNEKFGVYNREPDIFYDGLEIFYRIALFMKNLYREEEYPEEEYHSFKHLGILESIELVKKYYKENNIDIDLDELVCDGTINFVEQERLKHITKGLSHSENGKKLIEVWTQFNVFDAVVLLHELSHYKDQGGNTQVRDLFTEGIAYAEEHIFVDWLEENGFPGIKETWEKMMNACRHFFADYQYKNLKIYNLFDKMGNIDKDTYEYYYEDDTNYEEIMNRFDRKYDVQTEGEYVFGFAISDYIYDKYRKGEMTIQDIEKLHKIVNTDLDQTFEALDLEDLYEDNIEKLLQAMEDNYIDYDEELVMKH